MKNNYSSWAALVLILGSVWVAAAEKTASQSQRPEFEKAMKDGNFRDAYDGFRKLALDPNNDSAQVSGDLRKGIEALRQLGRHSEIDEFLEGAVAAHRRNWRLLETAAQSYVSIEQFGFIVGGKFERGGHRGGGQYVMTALRDRTRALQLMHAAEVLVREEQKANPADATAQHARFYMQFADLVISQSTGAQAWRLQALSDLTNLPDYDGGRSFYSAVIQGAPVDAAGNPVFYQVPRDFESARSDGEKWRWMLVHAVDLDPGLANEADFKFAGFLQQQFGEQTMGHFGFGFPGDEEPADNKSGTYALHTLTDDETIARLATGIRRFHLPEEFNFIKIFQRIAARGKSQQGEQSLDALATISENRRQYTIAAELWRKAIAEYGVGENNRRSLQLQQIVGNWGRFEGTSTQPAGKGATLDFRYRNATSVSFEAFPIDVEKLLQEVKNYLKGDPKQLDWSKLNIADVGYRIVLQNENQLLGARVAEWKLDLKPRPKHVDERITVSTPLQKAGAYLVTAKLSEGNVSRIVVWVADTVVVNKQLDTKSYYYAADSGDGSPIAKANLEFFGWKQEQIKPNQNNYRVVTQNFSELTDQEGQVLVDATRVPQDYQWMVVARAPGGRLAYLGFSNAWYGGQFDAQYEQTKVLAITDRPVYRPNQTVKFKLWVAQSKYDQNDASPFAGQSFVVAINNPKGETIFEKKLTADKFGGVDGEFALPAKAPLGVYSLYHKNLGGGTFRVEEYKKPEFEVKVDAPKAPVSLGEKLTATVEAKYYFGAPVVSAKVKYKVLRTNYSGEWHPVGTWDWFYGRGYWWFASDYTWYPGWNRWGCLRPVPIWWGRPLQPPEVVAENESPIGPDGKISIEIDTLPAKELHGNSDHQYSITAEVIDESRRTIVGTGKVLVARQPFRVFAWVDRGHYRAGDDVVAHFQAHTLDQKPVPGKGVLQLLKISYNEKNEPVEQPVETWNLDTDEQGQARQQIKAAVKGQYRLSYKVTDAQEHTIEGGYLFVVRGDDFNGREFRFNDVELVTEKREYAPGEKVRLMVNTNRADSTVLLFLRPANGVYLPPQIVRLSGKSTVREIDVVQKDMPNFFIEALTISDGRLHNEMREVVVPPEKRVINVEVDPTQKEYRPGADAKVNLKLTDAAGKPVVGSTVVSIYDKSVEYISAGSNVPEIREFFWKWRRNHYPRTESTLSKAIHNLLKQGETPMSDLGVFGAAVAGEWDVARQSGRRLANMRSGMGGGVPMAAEISLKFGSGPRGPANAAMAKSERAEAGFDASGDIGGIPGSSDEQGEIQGVAPTVRKNFADTAFWAASIVADEHGRAEVSLTMPENLTGWKIKAWTMGLGTKVGQGEAEIVTRKNLLVRLQAPRFFVEKDEVVLSANVHNYLDHAKPVDVSLELEGDTLAALGNARQRITVSATGEKRVDWRVRVARDGEAVVRMKAVTDEESDAMEMRFPVYVHGMLKMESYSGKRS